MKRCTFLLIAVMLCMALKAQQADCVFQKPYITIHFGKGVVRDVNTGPLNNYNRVRSYCPVDGHFSYSPYTSDCFSGDWHTLFEDHTPGDQDGNMVLINGSPRPGAFLITHISPLKAATTYEFGVWLMNLCKITEKCPFPLLPNISIQLSTTGGQVVTQLNIGDVQRVPDPVWTQHRAVFTTPATPVNLVLTMMNNAPGGCGNDFALDDITFRECIQPPLITKLPPPPAAKKPPVAPLPKTPPRNVPKPVAEPRITETKQPTIQTSPNRVSVLKRNSELFPPPPAILTNRNNTLVKKIETPPAEILIELYDNGEIDGDTVSIYHNNVLIRSQARLSEKPISFKITVNESQPYHELIMVANNLGSIPPNTSVMIVTAGKARHELFISSTEQKNAKVILDLKK